MKRISLFTLLLMMLVTSYGQTKPDVTFIRKGNSLLVEKNLMKRKSLTERH